MARQLRGKPPQQLEIGEVDGKLTDQNPLDRIALWRVAAELNDVGIMPHVRAAELYAKTREDLQKDLQKSIHPGLGGARIPAYGRSGILIRERLLRYLPVARVPNCAFHESGIFGNPGQRRWHNALLADQNREGCCGPYCTRQTHVPHTPLATRRSHASTEK